MVRANPRVLEGVSSDDNDSVFDEVGFFYCRRLKSSYMDLNYLFIVIDQVLFL